VKKKDIYDQLLRAADRGGVLGVLKYPLPPPDLLHPSPNFSCWLKEALAIKFLQRWILVNLFLTATVEKGRKDTRVAKKLGKGQ